MEETKIANQIINDDFPEMMNDKQKMVLKKLIIEELSLNNHDFDEVYKIFDEYLADGNAPTDFIQVIIEIYQVSGLIPKENEKN